MNLPEFSVKKSVTVLMVILIILVFGVISFMRLGIELIPDISFPVASCITRYPGVAPEDVENMVTKPIEGAISTVKGVKDVMSTSQEGLSMVMVEFEWGTNIDFAAQDMRDMLEMVKDYLPEDASEPLIMKFDPSMMPVLAFSMTGERSMRDLGRIADDVKDRLEQVEGVASVMTMGGIEREIRVKVDRDRLGTYGLSLTNITNALRFENLNLPGGHISRDYNEWLIRTVGEYEDLDELRNTVIGVKERTPVYLKNVAEVVDSHKERRSYGRTNKRESIILMCSKTSGANTSKTGANIKKELKKLEEILPEDIEFNVAMDQGETTNKVVRNVTTSALWGALLAVFALFLFFRNWRPTLTVALSIPISVLATFIAIHAWGYTLNIMTIGGFALGVGMLLSNAVIVIENIFRWLEEGKSRVDAASGGTIEVTRAIVAATLTTIAVFFPLIYTPGMAGQISKGLALTVVFSLLASLLVAVTIIPMLASKIFIKRKRRKEYEIHYGEKFFKRFNNTYRRVLIYSLSHRRRVGLIAIAIFVVSICLSPFVGTEFIPKMDSSMIMQTVELPEGTSLDETNRVVENIENVFLKQPESEIVASFVGESELAEAGAMMGGGAGVNRGMVMAKFKHERKRGEDEIKDAIRKEIPEFEGGKIEFTEGMGTTGGGGGEGAPIEIKIFGPDLGTLDRLSLEIMEQIKDVSGIRDIDRSIGEGKPELRIRIDRDKTSQIGLPVALVAKQVEGAMKGNLATRYREKGEEIDVRVGFREEDKEKLSDIENISIATPMGVNLPLKSIARIEKQKGPVQLLRENRKRHVSVTAGFSGRDLGSVMADIRDRVKTIGMPEDYFVDYGGEAERMYDMFRDLGVVFILAILIVYMIMAATFESLVHPLVVMFTLPFAVVGVILALLLTGKTLSLVSALGAIILVGVIVNNGIVLIDYVNRLRGEGLSKDEALIQGGVTKLRAIVLITLTAILGLLPMAVRTTRFGAMMAPMAITVIGGLLVGTILTLIIIPVVYSVIDEFAEKTRMRARRIIHGE